MVTSHNSNHGGRGRDAHNQVSRAAWIANAGMKKVRLWCMDPPIDVGTVATAAGYRGAIIRVR